MGKEAANRGYAEPPSAYLDDQIRPSLWQGRLRYVGLSTTPLSTTRNTDIFGIGHALRRNAAGAFGPDLAKKLAQLVKMEKNVMRSLETVAKERMEVAVGETLLYSCITF